ncbi:MAG TPA: hypothetical protein VN864_02460 [Thermoplasmata archaeon]|nr:hypothetical protein [Thermoplasmata archaeon]
MRLGTQVAVLVVVFCAAGGMMVLGHPPPAVAGPVLITSEHWTERWNSNASATSHLPKFFVGCENHSAANGSPAFVDCVVSIVGHYANLSSGQAGPYAIVGVVVDPPFAVGGFEGVQSYGRCPVCTVLGVIIDLPQVAGAYELSGTVILGG